MIKIIVCSMIGFSAVLSLILLFGAAPEWVGAGVKDHPIQSALFLLWMSLCSSLLVFKNKPRRNSFAPGIE
jgi:hypothetical protein